MYLVRCHPEGYIWLTGLISSIPVCQISDRPGRNIHLFEVIWNISLSLANHIIGLTKSWMDKLRRVREVRKTLSTAATLQCVLTTAVYTANYCDSLTYGVPDYLISKIQITLNFCR